MVRTVEINGTQIIQSRKLLGTANIMMFIFGIILPILISALGNYAAFAGGWSGIWPVNVGAIVIAIGMQAICTIGQWSALAMWRERRDASFGLLYVIFLAVSAFPSFWSYNPAIQPLLTPLLVGESFDAAGASSVTALIVFLASAGIDILPERLIVKHTAKAPAPAPTYTPPPAQRPQQPPDRPPERPAYRPDLPPTQQRPKTREEYPYDF